MKRYGFGLGIIAAALAGTSLFAGSLTRALDEMPDVPFGWDFSPGKTRNGSVRSSGGRAHRRWRKRRASGRA